MSNPSNNDVEVGIDKMMLGVLVKAERIGGYKELNQLALWLAKQRAPVDTKALVRYLEQRRADLKNEPAITAWGKS